MTRVILYIFLIISISCVRKEEAKPAPITIDQPAEFTVKQRSTNFIPSSNDKIKITVDDITNGQVLTSMSWSSGENIFPIQSLRVNSKIPFSIHGHSYTLELTHLKNKLLGTDSATFILSKLGMEDKSTDEDKKIIQLIQALNNLQGAEFIRNGKKHSVKEAVEHMTRKWKWKKSEIKTVEDFIRVAATKSSSSGKYYTIRFKDGKEIKSVDWFKSQL